MHFPLVTSPSPCTHNRRATWAHSKNVAVWRPGREVLPEINCGSTLIVDFWPPEEKLNFCYLKMPLSLRYFVWAVLAYTWPTCSRWLYSWADDLRLDSLTFVVANLWVQASWVLCYWISCKIKSHVLVSFPLLKCTVFINKKTPDDSSVKRGFHHFFYISSPSEILCLPCGPSHLKTWPLSQRECLKAFICLGLVNHCY